MTDRTTALERVRQEYRSVDLAPSSRTRIGQEVFGSRITRSPLGWAPAFAAGAAAGLVLVTMHYLLTQNPSPPLVAFSAIATNVEGTAGVSEADASEHRLRPRETIAAGTWLETDATASVGVEIGPHRAKVGASTRLMFERVEPQHMTFSLQKGSVRFVVDPLPPGSSLSVRTGPLTVDVIGTAFSVERTGRCAQVSVSKGVVRTSHEGQTGRVVAGRTEHFCESARIPSAAPDAAQDASVGVDARAPSLVPTARPGGSLPPEAAAAAASRAFTEEERLFKSGLEALQGGRSGKAREELKRYLRRFPAGTFAQDAELHLVRLSYGSGNAAETVMYGRRFLSHVGGGARSDEVRVLVAQSLLQQSAPPEQALALVAPVAERLSGSSNSFAEQVTYLVVLAASRSGRHDQAQTYARSYLQRFPKGRYADEVRIVVGP